jgi:hypothetical protein
MAKIRMRNKLEPVGSNRVHFIKSEKSNKLAKKLNIFKVALVISLLINVLVYYTQH